MGSSHKQKIASITNRENFDGSLQDAMKDADVLIGVSGKGNLVTKAMISSMSREPIVFALSNPDPEIMPADAKKKRELK